MLTADARGRTSGQKIDCCETKVAPEHVRCINHALFSTSRNMSIAKSATAPTEERGCLKCAGGGRVQSIDSSHSDPDAHESSEQVAAPGGAGGA